MRVDVVPGQTTYSACFDDVTRLIAGRGFDSLRVDVASSTIPGIMGTTTKSASFSCTGSGSGGGAGPGSGAGTSSSSGGGASTALAETGGLDYRFPLIGLLLFTAGLLLLMAGRACDRVKR